MLDEYADCHAPIGREVEVEYAVDLIRDVLAYVEDVSGEDVAQWVLDEVAFNGTAP